MEKHENLTREPMGFLAIGWTLWPSSVFPVLFKERTPGIRVCQLFLVSHLRAKGDGTGTGTVVVWSLCKHAAESALTCSAKPLTEPQIMCWLVS